jgi:hypothetical protein
LGWQNKLKKAFNLNIRCPITNEIIIAAISIESLRVAKQQASTSAGALVTLRKFTTDSNIFIAHN